MTTKQQIDARLRKLEARRRGRRRELWQYTDAELEARILDSVKHFYHGPITDDLLAAIAEGNYSHTVLDAMLRKSAEALDIDAPEVLDDAWWQKVEARTQEV